MQTPVHNDKVIPLNRASSDAVQNLAKLALVDDVTGLYNRRFLFNYLDRIVGNHETSTCLSLAIIDIDFFKAVNDNYGHLCGDSVLASFAAFLKTTCAKMILLCVMQAMNLFCSFRILLWKLPP